MKLNADFHYHGPIDFSERWLKLQGYGGKNLLKLIVDACIKKEVGVCAIVSDNCCPDESVEEACVRQRTIEKDSIYNRLKYLINTFGANLPHWYGTGRIGDNVFVVQKQQEGKTYGFPKPVFLINAESVFVKEGQRIFDHLVIGASDIPSFMNLQETLDAGEQRGLIQIAEHPLCEAHFGMGRQLFEEYADRYTVVEGHNSQFIFPDFTSRIPFLRNYSKRINRDTQKICKRIGKLWVANSDAHRIKDVGVSYNEFDEALLDCSNETKFLFSLKNNVLAQGKFKPVCGYENPFGWVDWVSKYIRMGVYK